MVAWFVLLCKGKLGNIRGELNNFKNEIDNLNTKEEIQKANGRFISEMYKGREYDNGTYQYRIHYMNRQIKRIVNDRLSKLK